MSAYYNRHYITTDSQDRIVDGWSDGPHRNRDTDGAICINEEGGYQFQRTRRYTPWTASPCTRGTGKL